MFKEHSTGSIPRRLLFAAMMLASLILMPTDRAYAADYPTRPIRVIVAVGPGGVSDIFIRALGERLVSILKQPLVIENRPGGAFNIATRACADAPPDGYTICLLPGEPLTYNQFLFKDIGYDPTAFVPITNLFFITQALTINSSLGAKNLGDLAALANKQRGTLSYSSPALSHTLFIEEFKRKNDADIVWVPFKGGGDAATGLLSGNVPIVFIGLGNVISFIEAGKANALAVDSEQRSPLVPEVPTLRETGYTGPITRAYFGLVAPPKTPPEIIEALNKAIAAVLQDKDFVQKQLTAKGLDLAIGSAAEFAELLKNDRKAAEQVVKASGRKAE